MKVPFYEDLKNGVNSIKALLQFKNSLYMNPVLFEKSNKKMMNMKFLHEKKNQKKECSTERLSGMDGGNT